MHRLLCACAALLATPAAAAPWFADATASHLPAKGSVGANSMDVESADLDGDGDLDLVVPQEFLLNKVLLNDGRGRFTDASSSLPALTPAEVQGGPPLPGHDSEDVSIADFDRDGVLDILIVSEDDIRFGRTPAHEFYRGLGGGRYARVLGQVPDTEANAVAHADVDRDGDLDLLVVGAGQDRLLIGDGGGGFRDETDQRLPREAATGQDGVFADVDGDRDLDIVLGVEGGHFLWINDGAGRFADETAQRLPVAGFVEARKVEPGDVDGDGDLDLYLSHVGWQGKAPADALLINDGRGRFTRAGPDRLPPDAETTLDGRFADLDGDRDLDLVRANFGSVQILANDGRGSFRDVTAEALPAPLNGPAIGVEIADFDQDGRLDLYIAMRAANSQDAEGYDRLLLGAPR